MHLFSLIITRELKLSNAVKLLFLLFFVIRVEYSAEFLDSGNNKI